MFFFGSPESRATAPVAENVKELIDGQADESPTPQQDGEDEASQVVGCEGRTEHFEPVEGTNWVTDPNYWRVVEFWTNWSSAPDELKQHEYKLFGPPGQKLDLPGGGAVTYYPENCGETAMAEFYAVDKIAVGDAQWPLFEATYDRYANPWVPPASSGESGSDVPGTCQVVNSGSHEPGGDWNVGSGNQWWIVNHYLPPDQEHKLLLQPGQTRNLVGQGGSFWVYAGDTKACRRMVAQEYKNNGLPPG